MASKLKNWIMKKRDQSSSEISIAQQVLQKDHQSRDVYSNLRELGPKKFTYEDINMATNNFNIINRLHKGVSGSVFKGNLKNGTVVAVKRVEGVEYGGFQYIAEVTAIAPLKHIHLVHLHGYCTHVNEKGTTFYVVYDYVPNGSLSNWILKTKVTGKCLSWSLRYRVALEIAKVLIYLHHDCGEPRIHLDIKPANVLLDENCHSVLSDFGMSKVMKNGNSADYVIRGTQGYIAPEWFLGHHVSVKFDIFSYGKLLLDFFFGDSYVCLDENGNDIYNSPLKGGNTENERIFFHDFMLKEIGRGTIRNHMDSRLLKMNEEVNEKEVICLVRAALSCIQDKPDMRPSNMKEVLDILEGNLEKITNNPSPTQLHVQSNFTTEQPRPHFVPPRLVEHFDVYASREATKKEIIEALENTNFVGVYGMGGVGKTTLMKQIRDEVGEEKLFSKVVLATVSQNLDLRGIQTQIAENLGFKFEEETVSVRANRLAELLKREGKILLILDDAWERFELVNVGIVVSGACQVLIVSRSEEVCSSMRTTRNIEVKVLSSHDSLKLFQKEVGCEKSHVIPKISEEIVKECKGLPLAIVTLALTLRSKKKCIWIAALEQLRKSVYEGLQPVNTSIKLSYDHLESSKTKACFLLCSLFPEDHQITMDKLLGYAMGEGLLEDVVSMKEAREHLDIMVDTLVCSGLLLKEESDDEYEWMDVDIYRYVMMHDIVRDVAILIARGNKNGSIIKAGVGLQYWPHLNEPENCLQISLMKNYIRAVADKPELSKLKTLSLASNEGLTKIPNSFFEGMKSLATLDLSSAHKDSFKGIRSLPQSLSFLNKCLRSLYLENCTGLKDISLIGNLETLEILCLRNTGLFLLPEEIRRLTNLKILDLTCNRNLKYIPPNVLSSLSKLEELHMKNTFHDWEIEDTKNTASLVELASLTKLTSLELDIGNPKWLSTDISTSFLKNLTKFHIVAGMSHLRILPQKSDTQLILATSAASYPPADWIAVLLEKTVALHLELKGDSYQKNVLQFYPKGFENIKYLSIDNVGTMERVSEAMLPQLEVLEIWHMKRLKSICNASLDGKPFTKLKVLKVNRCPNLLEIMPLQLMQHLEEIRVVHCDKLKSITSYEHTDTYALNEGEEVVEDYYFKVVLPRLRTMSLEHLPTLSEFFSQHYYETYDLPHVNLECPSLQSIEITECRWLKRLPFGLQSTPKLQRFITDGFGELEYNNPFVKSQLQPIMREIKQRFRLSGIDKDINREEQVSMGKSFWVTKVRNRMKEIRSMKNLT